MAKQRIVANLSVNDNLYQEIEDYMEFCRSYGYKFNEADVRNMRSYAYQQFSKFASGKTAKNMWEVDAERLGCNI